MPQMGGAESGTRQGAPSSISKCLVPRHGLALRPIPNHKATTPLLVFMRAAANCPLAVLFVRASFPQRLLLNLRAYLGCLDRSPGCCERGFRWPCFDYLQFEAISLIEGHCPSCPASWPLMSLIGINRQVWVPRKTPYSCNTLSHSKFSMLSRHH